MKGIIFDLDGVIVHTDRFHYLAWKLLADELGVPFSEKDNHRLRGVSRMESLNIILEKSDKVFTESEKEVFCEKKNEVYRDYLYALTPDDIKQEVLDTLTALKQRGYNLAIGSSSRNAKIILTQTGLIRYFDAVSDGTNISYSKPNPEVFLKAAEFLGLQMRECYVVEDAAAGIEAGKAAGAKTIATGEAAKAGIADYEIGDFRELLVVCESIA
jgi:beta-phosphoglucomutase